MTQFSPPRAEHAPLFAALPDLYYVGGCVRNGWLQKPIDDYDLACALPPEETLKRLTAYHIKTVPTGLAHGTLTAVLNGVGFEITAFRADVTTDGRHADVRFGSSLQEDARRRDFTMNALYARADGDIIDPVDGLPDLARGLVRFIGDPEQRIREDFLRILRFFRFHAAYGRTPADADALNACSALREGLRGLSRERVHKEVLKTLAVADPRPVVALMHQTQVWQTLFGASATAIERVPEVRAETRLMLWLPEHSIEAIDQMIRLTSAQKKHLSAVKALLTMPLSDAAQVRAARQQYSAAAVGEALRIQEAPAELLALAESAPAVFPVGGDDLQALGIAPGKAMGEALRHLRARWVAQDMQPSKAELLQALAAAAKTGEA